MRWTPEERLAHFAKKEGGRQDRAAKWEEKLEARAAEAAAKYLRPVKPHASRFTTQAAIDWGRAQGWKLLGREAYDARTRRHHDAMLGTDCVFDDMVSGMVAVQGAGRYERKAHWERFEQMGGVARARRLKVRVVYVEFRRGDPEPVLFEEWA